MGFLFDQPEYQPTYLYSKSRPSELCQKSQKELPSTDRVELATLALTSPRLDASPLSPGNVSRPAILASGIWVVPTYCPRPYPVLSWTNRNSQTLQLPGMSCHCFHYTFSIACSNQLPLQGREGYLINGVPLTRVCFPHLYLSMN